MQDYTPEINSKVIEDLDDLFDQYNPIDPVNQRILEKRNIIQTFYFVCIKHGLKVSRTEPSIIYLDELYDIYSSFNTHDKKNIYQEMQAIIPDNKKKEYGIEIAQIFMSPESPYRKVKEFAKLFALGHDYDSVKNL